MAAAIRLRMLYIVNRNVHKILRILFVVETMLEFLPFADRNDNLASNVATVATQSVNVVRRDANVRQFKCLFYSSPIRILIIVSEIQLIKIQLSAAPLKIKTHFGRVCAVCALNDVNFI